MWKKVWESSPVRFIREMVALYYDQGMTMPQIAERLGVNRSTVSRTLRRARDRLYRFLRYTL